MGFNIFSAELVKRFCRYAGLNMVCNHIQRFGGQLTRFAHAVKIGGVGVELNALGLVFMMARLYDLFSGVNHHDKKTVTAAVLIIGNEILSGRTADKNINHIAVQLTEKGIQLREARVVPDVMDKVVGR